MLRVVRFNAQLLISLISTCRNWFPFLLFYFGAFPKRSTYIIHLRNGLIFSIRRRGGDSIAIYEDYYIKQYYPNGKLPIKTKDTIIDLGAHIGTFSILAASKASQGHVYTYEPDPHNYEQELKNIELNHLENVKAYKQAAWYKKTTMKFFYEDNSSLGPSLLLKNGKKSYKVACTPLEEIYKVNKIKHVDLLKIDIEGAEYELIFKTDKKLFKKVDKIFLEYHIDPQLKYTKEDLKKYLAALGFSVKMNEKLHMMYAKKK